MIAEVVSLTRPARHRLVIGVQWPDEVVQYELTEVATPLTPVIELDDRFHRDFSDNVAARMRILQLARRAFRGEDVPLPETLPDERQPDGGGSRPR